MTRCPFLLAHIVNRPAQLPNRIIDRRGGITRPPKGTVTLIEKCSGAVGFDAVATEHRWVVHISGGSVGRR